MLSKFSMVNFLHIGVLLFSLRLLLGSSTQGEVFTSLVEMEELLHAEAVLIRNLDGYLVEQGRKMEYLKRKLDEYQREHKTASANISAYLSNPVNAFLITKRLTSELKRIKYIMLFDVATEFLENITNSSKFLKFPTDEDLTGAVAALIRLQDTYKLNVSSFARGILNKVKFNTQMTANDCFEVGLHTYNNGDYYHTVLWMEEALERWDERSQTYYRDINKVDILYFLAYSLYSLGDIVAALNKTNELLQLMPDHQGALENREIFETEIANLERDWESDIPLVNKPVVYEDSPKEVYEMLCRGELEKTPAQQRPLRCRYISYSNLYLKIGPFKLEEANLDPYIVMFHEVLFDDEIQHIKISAKPRLSRAKVIGNQEGGDESSYRISKVAWLGETEHRILGRVVRRAADLTNLDMETSEELQVLNYGIGGQYEPHCDYFDDSYNNGPAGNRIATLLFYMNHVEQGGATVFPVARTAVWPQKGSAVFWYNLHSSGETDYRTRHASCPVLTGTKWVSNKWVRERGQEFRRPCGLQPDD